MKWYNLRQRRVLFNALNCYFLAICIRIDGLLTFYWWYYLNPQLHNYATEEVDL